MRFRTDLLIEVLLLVFTTSRTIFAQQILPRQTAVSSSPAKSSSNAIATTSSPAVPPCCCIWANFQGVKVNSWYTSTVKQYTATVITTFVKYDNTVIAANSTTIYLPKNQTFTSFGYFGPLGNGIFSVTDLPGSVPTTLLPDRVLHDGEYGATTVVPGNQTIATFDFTDLTIPSPTPYALFPLVGIYTYYPDETLFTAPPSTYDRNLCGTSTQATWLSYSSGTWNYSTTAAFVPPSSKVVGMLIGFSTAQIGPFPVVTPLPAPMPNDDVYVDLPKGISNSLVANKTLLSMYPWITNCFTYGGEGQPTVHITVDQLTSDSSQTVTSSAAFDVKSTSTPSPSSTPTTTPTTTPTITPTTTADTTSNPAANPPKSTTSTTSSKPTDVQTSADTAPSPSTNTSPPSGQSSTTKSDLATPATGSTTPLTFGGITATIQPLGTSAAAVGSVSLSVGGAAVTENGQTLSLITQSSGLAVVIDGTTTQLLPTGTSGAQVVTLGGQVYTPGGAAPSAVVVNGVTVKSGAVTVINGETVSLAGTNLVIASGTATKTEGLGGAIMNGLGGGSAGSASTSASTSSPGTYTGVGGRVQLSLSELGVAMCFSVAPLLGYFIL